MSGLPSTVCHCAKIAWIAVVEYGTNLPIRNLQAVEISANAETEALALGSSRQSFAREFSFHWLLRFPLSARFCSCWMTNNSATVRCRTGSNSWCARWVALPSCIKLLPPFGGVLVLANARAKRHETCPPYYFPVFNYLLLFGMIAVPLESVFAHQLPNVRLPPIAASPPLANGHIRRGRLLLEERSQFL